MASRFGTSAVVPLVLVALISVPIDGQTAAQNAAPTAALKIASDFIKDNASGRSPEDLKR